MFRLLFPCILFFLGLLSASSEWFSRRFSPLVLVPGNSGSQIEVKIDLSEPLPLLPHCPTQRDWFRAWMNVYEMLPGFKSDLLDASKSELTFF